MWISLVEIKVWMRGRSESLTAFQAASTSCALARARPQITGPWTSRAIACTASKSPGRGDRKAGLDDIHPETGELVGDLELLAFVQRDPRRLLPSRRVVSKILTRSFSLRSMSFPSPSAVLTFSLGLRLLRPPRAVPPEGGEKEKSLAGETRHA